VHADELSCWTKVAVQAGVGLGVGDEVGLGVGLPVGPGVGDEVGLEVGLLVGRWGRGRAARRGHAQIVSIMSP
jgi:hypothetical protein